MNKVEHDVDGKKSQQLYIETDNEKLLAHMVRPS